MEVQCQRLGVHRFVKNLLPRKKLLLNRVKILFLTECSKRLHPPNGKIRCESATNSLGSSCYLTCNPGYMPIQKTMTTCLYHNASKQFMWDVEGGFLYEIRFQIKT